MKYIVPKEKYDYGILLGGMIDIESSPENILFLKNNDRLLNTIELFSEKKIKKILISGASGSLNSELKEAEILKKYLVKIGIPDSCVITEKLSKNTYENATYCEKILTQIHKNEVINCLIITSDYHLRRSLACFKKTNLHADPYVKKPTIKHFDLEYLIVPQSSSLFGWKILLHEIVGYFTYKLLDYI